MLRSININDKFKIIPYIFDGKENASLTDDELKICCNSIKLMAEDSVHDRLADNYSKWLKLESMYIYSLLWDIEYCRPVMFSGAQPVTENCCRLFSRYYLFTDYRTEHTKNLYDKVDDFEVDKFHLEHAGKKYPFIFWSRDRGPSFFYRIKNARPDVFGEWEIYPYTVDILWRDNYQGIMYTGPGKEDYEKYIDELLFDK
jgi:hypothetical protein